MGTICLLAFVSLSASIWFAVKAEYDAEAINVAGSLRMQSWRLSEQVLIPELTSRNSLSRLILIFDTSINSPSLTGLQLREDDLGASYRSVVAEWYQLMRPFLAKPETYPLYIDNVPTFVDDIDQMVKLLQLYSERKLDRLRIMAVAFLFLILLISIMVMRLIKKDLLEPISSLGLAADSVRQGQFRHLDLSYDSRNEMGQLTQTFLYMAKDLSNLYENLESQVKEQTKALAQSNTALHLLYESSRSLGVNPYNADEVMRLLDGWKHLLNLEECYICLSDIEDTHRLHRIDTDVDQSPKHCAGHCQVCIKNPKAHPKAVENNSDQFMLSMEGQSFGFLYVKAAKNRTLTEESRQWLQTFSDIVASSLYQSRNRTRERHVLLMEERAVIARELHDSLAQALSYQKIQVVRLKRQLVKYEVLPKVDPVMNELQEGLNDAYRQLRELLNTFRLSVADGDLKVTLENTLKEYRHREPTIDFQLDYQLRYCPLDAHHQIHAVQIVREALSNIVQHAQASQAIVRCYKDAHEGVTITIDDNGKGIPDTPEKMGHFGTTIMKERASSMGGNLHFQQAPIGGTRIFLTFEVAS